MNNQKHKPNFLTCPGVPELPPARDDASLSAPKIESSVDKRSVVVSEEENEPRDGHVVHATKPEKEKELRKRFRVFPIVLVVLVVLVLVAVAPAGVALGRTAMLAKSAKGSISDMVVHIKSGDMSSASSDLDHAYTSVSSMRSALRMAGFWRDIPGVGTQIRALESAATAGVETLDGARIFLSVAKDISDIISGESGDFSHLDSVVDRQRSFSDLSVEEKRTILSRLDRAIPDMRIAQAKIDIALEAWNRIPQDQLASPIRKAFEPIAEALPRMKKTVDEALPILEVFVPLVGYPDPSSYLVLLQNSDEIRATGGFIGTIGRLKMHQGEIETFDFEDIYAVDGPVAEMWKETPPEPIVTYLGIPTFFLRDANWSPDFPTSAERIMDFYTREVEMSGAPRPTDLTGVIAINPPVFRELLRMVGPIEIDGQAYDANTFFDTLEYEVEVGFLEKGIHRDNRKDLLTKVGDELMNRLTHLPASKWQDLFDLLTQSFERKQMFVYAHDPSLLSRLDAFGWTGRAKSFEGDALWVIDSNLGALKTDGVMDKQMTYRIDAKDPSNILATVTLTYKNNAKGYGRSDDITGFKQTRYRSYTRVYVPEGAELISSSGAMKDDRYRTGGRFVGGKVDVYRELGRTVFAAFWSIEPKTSQELSFTYRLPVSISKMVLSGKYQLDWTKQSGNDAGGLTLDLSFGKNIQKADPAEVQTEWGDALYRVESNTLQDRAFQVTF